MLGLIGKKIGMTQTFDEDGNIVPITAIKVEPNFVVGKRTQEKHGYNAVILGVYPAKKNRLLKAVIGQFPDDIEPTKLLYEMRDYEKDYKVGDSFGPEIFEAIPYVDVCGISKGKGYQGVMKRFGFRGGRKTHGSKFHRAHGSTGMAASPSRIFKGTKMAGRMGGQKTTVQNLSLFSINKENGLLLIKGSVPGRRDSVIVINKSKKK